MARVSRADDLAPAVLDRLGVAETVGDAIDPLGMLGALTKALVQVGRKPVATGGLLSRHVSRLGRVGLVTAGRMAGLPTVGPVAPDPKDRRRADRTWEENAVFYGLWQAYLVNRQLLNEALEVAGLEGKEDFKARFGANLLADALAPTNFLLTNPAAIRRAAETGGLSLIRGLRNMVDDALHNGGWPKQVDKGSFALGRNMAATPGKVVFRNALIELIQYEPVTPQTHEIPLLLGPPWINKYYIFDIAPGKSLAEWAVAHGMTVFALSYRNPDESMRDVGFDDYLLMGPRAALDVIRRITGAETVNTLSACLGGTLNTVLLAYLDATGDQGLVNSSTLLNSLVDHSGPGTLSQVFTDPTTVAGLERSMQGKGYLEASKMAHTFDLLRANDLVFSYLVSGWMQGEKPAAFDLLAWNDDSTRMPAKMHTFYLRECWLKNSLAHDQLVLAGEELIVSAVDVEHYIVAAVDDHIVPWECSYTTTQLIKGDTRFVLSSAGHIAGIVNPPNPKCRLWTNPETPADPAAWRAGATEHHDTWWNDWLGWILPRSGDLRTPPPTGNDAHPVLAAAPGTYVFG